jgi:hypothetical protein
MPTKISKPAKPIGKRGGFVGRNLQEQLERLPPGGVLRRKKERPNLRGLPTKTSI